MAKGGKGTPKGKGGGKTSTAARVALDAKKHRDLGIALKAGAKGKSRLTGQGHGINSLHNSSSRTVMPKIKKRNK